MIESSRKRNKVTITQSLEKIERNKRSWVNDKESSFTGSFVTYQGWTDCGDTGEPKIPNCFIEFSDCHSKSRLHMGYVTTDEDIVDELERYHRKVKRIRKEIVKYEKHMKDLRDKARKNLKKKSKKND